jgi:hypothetical protein
MFICAVLMHKAVMRCARPMLTTPLHPTQKGRTLFTPHLPHILIQGTLPPARAQGDLGGRVLELIIKY